MYKDMNKILKDGKLGKVEISHFSVGEKDLLIMMRSGIPEGEYVRLLCNGEVLMSDTPMEKETNYSFLEHAHGDVLIGGLGIGMILLAIQDKENIESITVIEKEADIISLVGQQLPLNEKVKILQGDIFEYVPEQRYHTIYIDIWPYINSEIYRNEMRPLISRYRKHLVQKSKDPDRYINCWCSYEAKNDIPI